MSEPLLDRDSGVPLYAQIRDVLRGQILGQHIAPGEHLPGELELQERFGVARSVIRQALSELADAGLIRRERGRGSVVVPTRLHHRRAEQAGGLSRQLAAAGEHLRTVVLDLRAATAPDAAVPALRTADAWRIERLRFVDEEPLVFMRSWVSRELFPDLTADAIEGSLLGYMRSTGVVPVGGPRQLRAVPADPTVADHLGIDVGTPVLLLQALTNDDQGRGLEWSTLWHQPSTVFDVDAKVETRVDAPADPAAPGSPDFDRVRELIAELASIIGPGRA
ncbi:GntR family transcriptional regulator [Mycolicibacterium wolinskyi]|uniref:GntR family transcriptional regulator n=1 Tax=Mycolicibacterium wolinskyi TaxID=59750 RepID=A0A132PTW7_9MYCO|nr:GntR family transcriptional regulator [Mycolicibacterium wolinskyi]KWX25714.1 GntR family transcriptional regulator [Mycolicibacterium wolinskyi]